MLTQNHHVRKQLLRRADNRNLTRLFWQNDGSFVGVSLFPLKKTQSKSEN